VALAIVDSDVLIDLLQGLRRPEVARLSLVHELAVTTISQFEVGRGATSLATLALFERITADWQVFSFDSAAASQAAAVYLDLRQAGTPIDTGDVMIAGIALSNEAAVITRNRRHFERIRGLEILEPA